MQILVAESAGFCWGVRQAMEAALDASARWGSRGPVRTLGPLIHNPQALESLARRGIRSTESLQEATHGTVIIRAHGIPVEQLRALQEHQRRGSLRLVNCTCPEVAQVQARIKRYASKGYFTVLLGSHDHAETLAHRSYATAGCAVVADLQEAEALRLEVDRRTLVIAQTTFLLSAFEEIVACIQAKVPGCLAINSVCKDTWLRQREAAALCERVDHVLVVGGRASNNTKHLVDLARNTGRTVQHLETVKDLDTGPLSMGLSVGVLAGASTPTWLVDDVIEALEAFRSNPGPGNRVQRFLADTAFLDAAGIGLMTLGIQHWLGWPRTWVFPLLAMTCPWGLRLFFRFAGESRARWLESRSLGILGRMPASKDLFASLALVGLAVLVPAVVGGHASSARLWLAVSFVFTVCLSQVALRGVLDLGKNRIKGREVLVTVLGKRGTKTLLAALALFVVSGLAVQAASQDVSARGWLQVLVMAAAAFGSLIQLWWEHDRFRPGLARSRDHTNLSAWLAGILAWL